MKKKYNHKVSFESVILHDLQQIVPIHPVKDQHIFDQWFSQYYALTADEKAFLQRIIDKHHF